MRPLGGPEYFDSTKLNITPKKIEKSLLERIGSSVFVSLFLCGLFFTLFQNFTQKYIDQFLGLFGGMCLIFVGLAAMWKIKDAIEKETS